MSSFILIRVLALVYCCTLALNCADASASPPAVRLEAKSTFNVEFVVVTSQDDITGSNSDSISTSVRAKLKLVRSAATDPATDGSSLEFKASALEVTTDLSREDRDRLSELLLSTIIYVSPREGDQGGSQVVTGRGGDRELTQLLVATLQPILPNDDAASGRTWEVTNDRTVGEHSTGVTSSVGQFSHAAMARSESNRRVLKFSSHGANLAEAVSTVSYWDAEDGAFLDAISRKWTEVRTEGRVVTAARVCRVTANVAMGVVRPD